MFLIFIKGGKIYCRYFVKRILYIIFEGFIMETSRGFIRLVTTSGLLV